jgi:carbon starvation protein
MLSIILLITCVLSYLAYRYYGAFLVRRCKLDDSIETPACKLQDGVDYVPTRTSVLFGHHFSSIAGAGPIVGPILAGIYFGWGPTWIWIMIGAIFVGGVHDFGSSFMSIRTGGRSIAETMRNLVGEGTGRLFMVFVILALIYVIVVFLDLTALTFSNTPEVATSSGWFVTIALIFGFVLTRGRIPMRMAILIFVPLTFLGLWIGHVFPAPPLEKDAWIILVLAYCYVAAILPVNVLLQPRDFLSSTFLYAMLGLGITGLIFSNAEMHLDFWVGWDHEKAGMLIPILFITVACGACSGFHSIVASGTTSKQIRVETDVRRVGYGAMLVEGILATFALACVAVLSSESHGLPATAIFAQGSAVLLSSLGIPIDLGAEFTLLAVSTFLLTTLDTCTRLTRFLIEELLNWRNAASRYLGTLGVVALPTAFAFQSFNGQPAWKAIWPLFGATNQLLAALALVTFMVFLKARRIKFGFVLVPTIFMIIMPMVALFLMIFHDGMAPFLRVVALLMFVLGLFVVVMSARFVVKPIDPELAEAAGSQA